MPSAGTGGIGSASTASTTAAAASGFPWLAAGGLGLQAATTLFGKDGVPKSRVREATTDQFQALVRAARQMGIHPLYALGSAQAAPASVIPGQSKWGSFAKDAALMLSGIEERKASTDLLKAQADYYRARAKDLNQPPAGTSQPRVEIGQASQPVPVPRMSSKLDVVNPDGSITRQDNPHAAMDISELAGMYLSRALNWKPDMGDFGEFLFGAWKRLGTKKYNELREGYRKYRGKNLPTPKQLGAM